MRKLISLDILYQLVIYEIFMAVLLLAFGVVFAVRYRERKRAAIKYLALTYIMFTFGALFAAYGHLIYTKYWSLILMDYLLPSILTGYFVPFEFGRIFLIFDWLNTQLVYNLEGYFLLLVYQWSASLIAAAIGHLFIYLFTLEAFKEVKRKYVAPYIIFLGVVISSLLINIENITTNWALAFALGLVTQGLLIYYAIKAMRLTDSKLYKRGFLLVSFTAVLFILFFASYLIDSVTGGWTIFLFVGWTLALISAVPTYIGYLLPDWFRRRYEQT
jgi:hypothetical protein